MTIQTYAGTMTPRERVLRAIHHERADRVPIDFMPNMGIYQRLVKALGLPGDYESTLEALGVDIRWIINYEYTGPRLFADRPGRMVDPIYGHVMKWTAHADGGYWDYCDFPLLNASPEEIAAFPVPDPDLFNYEVILAQIKAFSQKGYAVYIGNAGFGDIINCTGRVMGMEDTLMNLMDEEEATLSYIDRRNGMEMGVLERILDKAAEDVTFVSMGEDLGTQRGPMIGMDLYKSVLRPRHQRMVDVAKHYGKPVMIHSCGSSSWAFEDFIDMGISIVDTLQPEASRMEPAYLKEAYGGRLCFHGCISTAGPLAYGTAGEVEKNVRETLEIMKPGGGYMLSPTHQIQDNSPVENVIAMYNAAHKYGVY